MDQRRWIALAFCALLCAAGAATAAEQVEAACQPVATFFAKRICPEEIEPKPAQQEQILKARAENLYTVVQVRLLDEYAKRNNLEPTQREMQRLGEIFDSESEFKRGLPREEVEKSQKLFYGAIIKSWKVHRSLYRRYGGKVALSGFGFAEPVDAIRSYLKEQENSGVLRIHDPELAKAFWQALTERSHAVFESKAATREAFETPPWEAERKRRKDR